MLTLRYSVRILWETGVLGEYSPRKGERTACEACKGGISTTQLYGGLQWDKSPKIERPCPIAHFKGFWGIEVVPFPQKSKGTRKDLQLNQKRPKIKRFHLGYQGPEVGRFFSARFRLRYMLSK